MSFFQRIWSNSRLGYVLIGLLVPAILAGYVFVAVWAVAPAVARTVISPFQSVRTWFLRDDLEELAAEIRTQQEPESERTKKAYFALLDLLPDSAPTIQTLTSEGRLRSGGFYDQKVKSADTAIGPFDEDAGWPAAVVFAPWVLVVLLAVVAPLAGGWKWCTQSAACNYAFMGLMAVLGLHGLNTFLLLTARLFIWTFAIMNEKATTLLSLPVVLVMGVAAIVELGMLAMFFSALVGKSLWSVGNQVRTFHCSACHRTLSLWRLGIDDKLTRCGHCGATLSYQWPL